MHHNNYNSNPFRKRPHVEDVVKRNAAFVPAYSSITPSNPQIARYSVYDPSNPTLFIPCTSETLAREVPLSNKSPRISQPSSVNRQSKPQVRNPIVSADLQEIDWSPPEDQLPLYVYNGMKKFAEKYFPISNNSSTFQIKKFSTLEYLPPGVTIDEMPKRTILFHCPINKTVRWKIKPWFYLDCRSVDIHVAEGWCRLNALSRTSGSKLTKYHSYFITKHHIDKFDLTIESQCNNELIMFLIFDQDAITPPPLQSRIAYHFMLIVSHGRAVRYIDYKTVRGMDGYPVLIEAKITNESGSIYFEDVVAPDCVVNEADLQALGMGKADLNGGLVEADALQQIGDILTGNTVFGYDMEALRHIIPDYEARNITLIDLKLSKCIMGNLENLSNEESYDFSSIVRVLFDKEWTEKGKSCADKLDLISDMICLLESDLNEEYKEELRNSNSNIYCVDSDDSKYGNNSKGRSPKITNEIIISDDEEEEGEIKQGKERDSDSMSSSSVEILEQPIETENNSQHSINDSPNDESKENINEEEEEEELSPNPQVIEDAMLDCDVDSPIELFVDDYSEL